MTRDQQQTCIHNKTHINLKTRNISSSYSYSNTRAQHTLFQMQPPLHPASTTTPQQKNKNKNCFYNKDRQKAENPMQVWNPQESQESMT